MADIYQHPLYYDILFGWDRSSEAFFYDAVFQTHGVNAGGKLLEAGCGTGQVAVRLARLGWHVSGLDCEQEMLSFFEDAAASEGVPVGTICSDMTDFESPHPFDGAYCPMGTLGHLPDDEAVVRHLQAMRDNLVSDGVYVVDIGFVDGPTLEWDYRLDEWGRSRGDIHVELRDGILCIDNDKTGMHDELPWDARLRYFNSDHFAELVESSEAFQIEAWYPEADRTDEGISVFNIACRTEPPVTERTMVVLRVCENAL